MVVCEILGVECDVFGIGCSFEWLAVINPAKIIFV